MDGRKRPWWDYADNLLNSDLAWASITFMPSSTYVDNNFSTSYRMGNACKCSIAIGIKTKIGAWSKVIIGRVSLPSKIDMSCVGHIQSTGKTVLLSIENSNTGNGKGYDIYMETFAQEIPAGEWIRGCLIYFYK